MQARRIARELALLSISQLPTTSEKLDSQTLQDFLGAAVRTLTTESQEVLETAAAELKRGSDRLLSSETRALELQTSKAMVKEAIELTQNAINRMGTALELPEFIQMTNRKEVRSYALQLMTNVHAHRQQVDRLLNQVMVDWQLSRLARIDQDILRIAVAEILFLGTPDRVAINEAIEIAKRYSDDDSHRFINGVLRRVVTHIKQADRPQDGEAPENAPPDTPKEPDETRTVEPEETPVEGVESEETPVEGIEGTESASAQLDPQSPSDTRSPSEVQSPPDIEKPSDTQNSFDTQKSGDRPRPILKPKQADQSHPESAPI